MHTEPMYPANLGRPELTFINGQAERWPTEVYRLWYTLADDADPKYRTARVTSANYFTPRPYRNEYDRGSTTEGFTYTLNGARVYQVLVPPSDQGIPPEPCEDCGSVHDGECVSPESDPRD